MNTRQFLMKILVLNEFNFSFFILQSNTGSSSVSIQNQEIFLRLNKKIKYEKNYFISIIISRDYID